MCERQRGSLKFKQKAASVCFSSRSSIGATSGETCEILSTRFWGTVGGAPAGRGCKRASRVCPNLILKVYQVWCDRPMAGELWPIYFKPRPLRGHLSSCGQFEKRLRNIYSFCVKFLVWCSSGWSRVGSGQFGSGRASVVPATPQQFTQIQQINDNSARLHEIVCPIMTTFTQKVSSVLTGPHIGNSVGGGASFSPMKAAQCCMKTGKPPPVLQLRAWALETSCLAPGSSRLSKCHWTESVQLWR